MTYLLKIKGHKKAVSAFSLEDARRIFQGAQDAKMRKGGVIRSAEVFDGQTLIARISQNGNVWPIEDWYPGLKPLVGIIVSGAGLDHVEEFHSNI